MSKNDLSEEIDGRLDRTTQLTPLDDDPLRFRAKVRDGLTHIQHPDTENVEVEVSSGWRQDQSGDLAVFLHLEGATDGGDGQCSASVELPVDVAKELGAVLTDHSEDG